MAWLFTPRFNRFDAIWIAVGAFLADHGHVAVALVLIFVCGLFSGAVEEELAKRGLS